MANEYAEMDQWSDDEVAIFKTHYQSSKARKDKNSKLTVISEGDSWFNYKVGTDLIDCLRNFHGYEIKNYASPGDTLENMIYGSEINYHFERVTPQVETVLERIEKDQPEVFLFSGAGNDIAGDAFITFLHHAESGLGVLKRGFAIDTINVGFRKFYQDLIAKVADVSPKTHIFSHGYGYARPTGNGVGILGVSFFGPWLLPALSCKGINPDQEGRQAVEELVNLFNEMLKALDEEVEKFHYIDLRPLICDNDWRDELHLKSSAYRLAADQFDLAINKVYPDI